MEAGGRVVFWGASDDLVEVDGDSVEGLDEYYYSRRKSTYVVEANGERLAVTASYGPHGTWFFAPGLVDDGDTFPDWPFTIRQRGPYTMELALTVPEGARVYPLGWAAEDDG